MLSSCLGRAGMFTQVLSRRLTQPCCHARRQAKNVVHPELKSERKRREAGRTKPEYEGWTATDEIIQIQVAQVGPQ